MPYQSNWDARSVPPTTQGPYWPPFFANPLSGDPVVFGTPASAEAGLASTMAELLLHFDGGEGSTTFTDSSANGHVVTPSGGAEQKTAAAVFGVSGGRFVAASSQYLSAPDAASWDILASPNWFIEFRAKPVAIGSQYVFVSHFLDGTHQWTVYHAHSAGAGKLAFYSDNATTPTSVISTAAVLAAGVAVVIGVERYNGTLYLYADGVVVGSGGVGATYTFAAPLYIGQNGNGTGYYDGDMDELRIQHREGPGGTNYIVNTAAYSK